MKITPTGACRRRFLRHGAHLAAAGSLAAVGLPARAAAAPRSLALDHTHTGEVITLTYAEQHSYLPDALQRLNRFLRDHYSGEVGHMDPALFDQLHRVQQALGARGPYQVISGYRCPTTNASLRLKGGGGVAKRSLHMDGRAIDVRLPGVPLAELRDAALSLRAGGVGYYPGQAFVHIDTGRVRSW
jgi:uncharacterized protein YcbK (DUF882 family)